jgi:hypothetical protein
MPVEMSAYDSQTTLKHAGIYQCLGKCRQLLAPRFCELAVDFLFCNLANFLQSGKLKVQKEK